MNLFPIHEMPTTTSACAGADAPRGLIAYGREDEVEDILRFLSTLVLEPVTDRTPPSLPGSHFSVIAKTTPFPWRQRCRPYGLGLDSR